MCIIKIVYYNMKFLNIIINSSRHFDLIIFSNKIKILGASKKNLHRKELFLAFCFYFLIIGKIKFKFFHAV